MVSRIKTTFACLTRIYGNRKRKPERNQPEIGEYVHALFRHGVSNDRGFASSCLQRPVARRPVSERTSVVYAGTFINRGNGFHVPDHKNGNQTILRTNL